MAENEWENIHRRQAEGIAAEKERGVHLGRPVNPVPKNFKEITRLWQQKEMSIKKAAALCGMSNSTFYYKAMKLRNP